MIFLGWALLLLVLLLLWGGDSRADGDGCSWAVEGVFGVYAWYCCCCCCCRCVEGGGDCEARTTGEGGFIFDVDGAEISVKGRA